MNQKEKICIDKTSSHIYTYISLFDFQLCGTRDILKKVRATDLKKALKQNKLRNGVFSMEIGIST